MSKVNLRTCIGSQRFGIEPHQAPPGDFPAQPSQKDGLGRMCKTHWNAYTRGLARQAKARAVAAAATASTEPSSDSGEVSPAVTKPTRQRGRTVADGLEAQRAEHADLERRLAVVGGAESDAGQAILEAAAAKPAASRSDGKGVSGEEQVPLPDAS